MKFPRGDQFPYSVKSGSITVRIYQSDVALEDGFITISATKAKTASRRVVPIFPNLIAWLTPYVKKSGPVVPFKDLAKQLAWLAADAGVKWKKMHCAIPFVRTG